MSEGVERALPTCLNLTWAERGEAVTATRPAGYLNKRLQAPALAGIVSSTSGPRGGFRLARRPEDATLLDVLTAIEGAEEGRAPVAVGERRKPWALYMFGIPSSPEAAPAVRGKQRDLVETLGA